MHTDLGQVTRQLPRQLQSQFIADKTEAKASGHWGAPRWPVWVGLAMALPAASTSQKPHTFPSPHLWPGCPPPGMPSRLWNLGIWP